MFPVPGGASVGALCQIAAEGGTPGRMAQLRGEERRGLAARGPELAADTSAHGADLGGLAGRVEASGLVRVVLPSASAAR